ncbi:MAG: hypothetical protein MJZ71_04965 [Bacteroidales bacterium]|nr:hypothetical protein [Bacteroidales bacterium]
MKKLITVLALLIAGTSFNVASAQEKNDFSVGLQGAFNFLQNGIGARFGYDMTDILRFTVDGTYYFSGSNYVDVFKDNGKSGTLHSGRLWDINSNLNFVFRKNSFHFYLIGGIGFAYGYRFNGLFSENEGDVYDSNGNYLGYGIHNYDVKECQRIGVSLNAGCGIEWQITSAFRWNLEQTLQIGIPSLTSWIFKTGVAYCF